MYSRPAGRCVAVFLKDRTRGYVLDERQLDLHQPEWPKNRAGTQYQLLKGHLRGSREFSSAAECASQLAEISSRFRYLDTRDLTGFIDGTENPKGKARAEVALIGSEDAPFAGGSYVFTQRYIHDLTKWAALPLDDRPHRYRGERRGVEDRPSQFSLRDRLRGGPLLHRLHADPRHPREDAGPHDGDRWRRAV